MKGLHVIHRNPPASLARMAGLSLIELMIAIALGLIVLAGLATLFANQSAARVEMERSSRQIENGRFAMELLADELRVAGFYGELSVRGAAFPVPAALLDPCSFAPADWVAAIPHAIQGYDNGAGAPPCIPADIKANTDILVIRRVSTCVADTANCAPAANGRPYIQVARCNTQMAGSPPLPALGNIYEFGLRGTEPLARTVRNCATAAGLRQYLVRIYYVAEVPAIGAPPAPDRVPVLKRLDFNAATNAWDESTLVEGIEQLQLEYGIDTDQDGDPDVYNANPTTYACGGCTAGGNWNNVMTARIHVLARNVDPSPRYIDVKTYALGRDAAGLPVTVTPTAPTDGNGYRRHAYSGLVRLVNPSDRRETP